MNTYFPVASQNVHLCFDEGLGQKKEKRGEKIIEIYFLF